MTLNFSDYEQKPKKRKSLGLILSIGALAGTVLLGSTLAADISLNSGAPVEFGQGIVQATSCDSQVKLSPVSSFTDNLWTVVDGEDLRQDGFIVSDFIVSDIANNCIGKQFIINAFGELSAEPLNDTPLIVNFVQDFGGFFTFNVNSPNTIQAFLPEILIDTTSAGEGARGETTDRGASSFHLGEWAGLYSNPGQVDARLVKTYTIQTRDIPADSLALQAGNYTITTSDTLDNRTIWVKGLYVQTLGHANDVFPNSIQSGVGIRQPFWIYVPTDETRNVTKTAYTFSGSENISCADVYENGDAGWIYECTPSTNDWSLVINYSGI